MTPVLVLLIEDNPLNLKLAREVLQADGFRTIEAGTAREGIALARNERPDAILMDIRLPDIDGVGALGHLRALPETRDIPVAAVTANAMKGDRERLLRAGFDAYIAKPIEVWLLPEQVRSLVSSTSRESP
jgi:two-component system, cell cycle response regulator DivK